MSETATFLSFIAKVLKSIESGDSREINLEHAPFNSEQELQIINTLKNIQGRNLYIEKALNQCVIGNYSAVVEEDGRNDQISKLLHVMFDKLREIVRQTNLIAQGDYSTDISPQSEKDELGIALFTMTKTLREIAEVSYEISAGDYSKQVEVKSDRDYLAHVINQMVSNLREMARQAKAIAEGDYTLEIGLRSECDVLSKSIDKMMRIIRSQLVALQQSNEDLEGFAHVASHDLNAPLHKIKYSCDLLKEECQGKVRASTYKLFDVIMRSCNQMNQLIGDLLEHARVGGSTAVFSNVNLEELVDTVISNLAQDIEKVGARITREPLPIVFADRTSLLQLFQNLIGNALKYRSSEPLVIEIRAFTENNNWVFSIKDNGAGIDSADHQRIFNSYVRLHSVSDIPGTGIGLATCKKIAKQLGGKIWVESELGKGSTFIVSFPKALPEIMESAMIENMKKKILLIDDDKAF